MAYKTLDEYKNEISIYEFIQYRKGLGFHAYKEGKLIHVYRRAKDKSGNEIKEDGKYIKQDHLIICRLETKLPNSDLKTLREVYFEKENFDEMKKSPKTIIDFIHTYVLQDNKLDFKRIVGVMNMYMDSPDYKTIENSSMPLAPANVKTENSIQKKLKLKLDLPSQETFDYFKSRNIHKDTYLSNVFIGTYGSYKDEKDTFNKIRPAFPLIDENNKTHTLQTIDFDGTTHKGKYFLSNIDRESALYQSNFIAHHSNTIILVESPEKAMAHYELYREEMAKQKVEPFYLSSCGYFTDNDLCVVRRNMEYRNVKNMVTGFDNDKAGYKYTLVILLYQNFVLPNFKIEKVENGNIHVNFDMKCKQLLDNKSVPYTIQNDQLVVVSKPNVLFTKLSPEYIKVHLPYTKDFLDDLAAKHKLPFHFTMGNQHIPSQNQNLSL